MVGPTLVFFLFLLSSSCSSQPGFYGSRPGNGFPIVGVSASQERCGLEMNVAQEVVQVVEYTACFNALLMRTSLETTPSVLSCYIIQSHYSVLGPCQITIFNTNVAWDSYSYSATSLETVCEDESLFLDREHCLHCDVRRGGERKKGSRGAKRKEHRVRGCRSTGGVLTDCLTFGECVGLQVGERHVCSHAF